MSRLIFKNCIYFYYFLFYFFIFNYFTLRQIAADVKNCIYLFIKNQSISRQIFKIFLFVCLHFVFVFTVISKYIDNIHCHIIKCKLTFNYLFNMTKWTKISRHIFKNLFIYLYTY